MKENIKWYFLILMLCFAVCINAADLREKKGGVSMNITSPAFQHNSMIPAKYTCDGINVNPPLLIEGIPEKTKSIVLIMDDPDAPMGTWIHWIVFNIPCTGTKLEIKENSIPGIQGWNDFRKVSYGGPCPPSGTHRYFFRAYALDTMLNLKEGVKRQELEKAMQGHILAQAEIIGLYKKQGR
ncbi:MAG TPA: YbhB/YbcL family Raf kinase inhibitor-like protein [Candidatus Ratteibacteria bacterium]|nr:YbhB/YbcL family Raf kinase inhibitor-like protein [bacterium]HPC28919.1 YbhB/YbcL family Raf kinase inhibitor-like protein [bacterium]HRS06582.1 YbhB/YbcL family Raf kinase inhibitor-like protein [Candidatus Ratteibacteria bacterium]HRV04537.1 YbhB/YbcL family Raf kinase inhibitor-like protein [Candidatus Ratteibacteria bacterium]